MGSLNNSATHDEIVEIGEVMVIKKYIYFVTISHCYGLNKVTVAVDMANDIHLAIDLALEWVREKHPSCPIPHFRVKQVEALGDTVIVGTPESPDE